MNTVIYLSYSEILELRRQSDKVLYVNRVAGGYDLVMSDGPLTLMCRVMEGSAEGVDFEANVLPFCNQPIEIDEVRFETHDYAHKGTWSGETTGDPAASWAAEHGAVSFDDVTNVWHDANGALVCYLDQADPLEPYHVWKDALGNAIVRYQPPASGAEEDGDWVRLDTGEVVTSSRWRITPYDGYKINIAETVLSCDSTAVIQSPFHYEVYSYYPPLGAVIKVRDWAYQNIYVFRAGADSIVMEPQLLPGHAGQVVHYSFDYRKTKLQVIDSRALQRLDIVTEGHKRVLGTKGATATFLARKVRSF